MTSKEFIVECVALSDEGRGICRIDNETLFVDNLLVGEKAKIKTTYKFGKLYNVEVLERLSDSPYRVKPLCKYYFNCGGCQLMHLKYEEQLKFKQNKVKNLLHKFSKIDIDLPECVTFNNIYKFRNKVSKPCFFNCNSAPCLGFYQKKSHDFIPVDNCLIEEESLGIISKEINRLIKQYNIEPYNEKNNKGSLRFVVIKSSSLYKENLVCFVLNTRDNKVKQQIIKIKNELIKRVKSIKSICINYNLEKTNVILGKDEEIIYGDGYIKDRIFNYDFVISASSFYQTNSYMVETLYKTGFDMLNIKTTDTILDAYSGTGTIGISISNRCKEVVLCELNKSAYLDSLKNIEINNVKNVISINDDCTEYLSNTNRKFDVLIMDPPRKGSTVKFIEKVCSMKCREVLYISCNPVTLARDLSYFKQYYEISKVKLVDMFPHGEHVETIVGLALKK